MSTPKNIDSTQQDVSASLLSFFAQNHCLQANSRAALMARGTVTPLDLSDYDVCSDAGGGIFGKPRANMSSVKPVCVLYVFLAPKAK